MFFCMHTGLSEDDLKVREIDYIDIVRDPVGESLECKEDPAKFQSKLTGRGPLKPGFERDCKPSVCVYKVVRVNLDFGPFQKKSESMLLGAGMRGRMRSLHACCSFG
jgi:hypothetical protein